MLMLFMRARNNEAISVVEMGDCFASFAMTLPNLRVAILSHRLNHTVEIDLAVGGGIG